MNDFWRKSWISVLGAIFILSSIVYLFKLSLSLGWLTDSLKIGLGLALGAGAALVGLKLLGRLKLAGEVATGLGAAVLYATFAFAGIYYALWDSMTIFICMLALTLTISILSFKMKLRLLMIMALVGGLLSPMLLRPETDQVFTLFLYLLVLNSAFFTVSIRLAWTELKLIGFAGTWLLYLIYFIQMHPVLDHFWSLPFRYAFAAYLFFTLAFFFSSWKSNLKFDGLNLYISFVNALIFGLWAMITLDGIASFGYPLLVMGLLYVLLAVVVYRLTGAFSTSVIVRLIGGILLLLLAFTQFGQGLDVKPLLSVYFWLVVAAGMLGIGQWKHWDGLRGGALAIWLAVGCYWFYTTWDTPWGIWFGVYLPFLNWAALAWELLAAMGFYVSLNGRFAKLSDRDNALLASVLSVLSHLVVGGLLTIQVDNMITYYQLERFIDLDLSLSVAWGIYALLLFVWGAYSRQNLYRTFGSVVLLGVAAKTLLLDLSGSETVYKVIVLFVLGVITFVIAYVNGKWKVPGEGVSKPEEAPSER
ncbi:DUF2339 domain-containing protein [Paenibacillus cremeus]|nr:DUF2339 domain-containing protein [Paenibacillus cremeus]